VRDGWIEAGAAVREARSRRWPTQKSFAAATGVPARTLGDVENGRRRSFGPATLGPIEDALGIRRGSIERFAREGVPMQPVPDPELDRLHAVWRDLSVDARRVLVTLAEAALDR
jgi:transcriptional regulator with XRE-family HTH domain